MKTTMTPSSRCLNVNCEMVEAFEAVLPKSILAKLEPFSFAICCKDGGYVICLQSFKALSDDVYHGPLTKYIDTTTTNMSSISSFVLMQCIIFHCMIQQFRQ